MAEFRLGECDQILKGQVKWVRQLYSHLEASRPIPSPCYDVMAVDLNCFPKVSLDAVPRTHTEIAEWAADIPDTGS